MKIRVLGAASVAFLASMVVAADPTLSADLSGKTAMSDVEHTKKLLDLLNAGKKGIYPRMKATAALLAMNAQEQYGSENGAKMAVVYDSAMKLAAAAGKKDAKAAADAVKMLQEAKGTGKATAEPVPLKDLIATSKVELGEVMELFSRGTGGGMNLEEDLKQLKKNGEGKDLALLAARNALLADLTMNLPNDKASGGMKKTWDEYSADMKKFSLEIATEAAKPKPDAAKLKAAAGKIDAACTNCHNKFRD
jgi:hypothetical protein